jgi:hypothetical protein
MHSQELISYVQFCDPAGLLSLARVLRSLQRRVSPEHSSYDLNHKNPAKEIEGKINRQFQ